MQLCLLRVSFLVEAQLFVPFWAPPKHGRGCAISESMALALGLLPAHSATGEAGRHLYVRELSQSGSTACFCLCSLKKKKKKKKKQLLIDSLGQRFNIGS